jgi:hypothetical protein
VEVVGLEMVELILDCEDEFGIRIPDEFGSTKTVGEFFDALLPLIKRSYNPEVRQRADLEEYAWTRFIEDLGYG